MREPTLTRKPVSRSIVERCRSLEGAGLRTFVESDPLVWDRAEGSYVFDADGHAYLDLYAGFAVAAVGHRHGAVVAAIHDQVDRLMHCPSAHPSRTRADFLEAVASIAPSGLDRVIPAITGAMANEIALALAQTRRRGIVISFSGAYMGRSLGVVGLAGKARYRQALGIDPAAEFAPYPYPLRMGPHASNITLEHLEEIAARARDAGGVSAVMIEPIQGNGGVVIPPGDFFPKLRDFCDRHGALLVVDEIQSGCGRTGRMWAIAHSGITPDLMTIGKGIGGGMAVGAVLGNERTMKWPPDSYTSTFLTNGVNLAAATAAIGVLKGERLVQRSAVLGPELLTRLSDGLGGTERIAEVRGRGLWVGIEIAGRDGAPAARRIAQDLRSSGVIVGRGGHEENVIKLSPPLTIDEGDLWRGVDLVVDAVLAA